MTTTRLRRSVGIGWRNTLFQTCDSVILSTMAMTVPMVAISGRLIASRPIGPRRASQSRRDDGRPPRIPDRSGDHREPGGGRGTKSRSDCDEAIGVGPLAQLFLEFL